MGDKKKKIEFRKASAASDSSSVIFPRRRAPTFDSLESYIVGSHRQASRDEPRDIPTTFVSRPSRDASEIASLASRRSGKTNRDASVNKEKIKNVTEHYDVRNQYYAGIAHSDLDIQTGRPPLMFHMHFLEWLWLQSGTRHRILLMALGALFCLVLLHFVFGVYMLFSIQPEHNPYLCNTESCNYLSNRLREKLNKSVNPCDDFYAFVCGSSDIVHNLTEEEDEEWNYGFDVGRVVYDFRYSSTLGRMLKKTRNKPENLVLDMYQACLDNRRRNKLGLEPYYKVLKEFGLYDASLKQSLSGTDVVKSMAKILAHSYFGSAVLKVNFYRQDANSPIKAYIETAVTEPLRAGPVFRFGYKVYHEAVHAAFAAMKDELQVTDKELEVLPHDIVCMELFFRDEYTPERMKFVVDDPDNVGRKPCELGNGFTGSNIQANFGTAPNGKFDFDLLIRTMFSVSNPDWDPKASKNPFNHDFNDPTTDPSTDSEFIVRLKKEFERSAPIRFLRYLQWRVLYATEEHLSGLVDDYMLPVKRHENLGLIANCFHMLFTWLPFLGPHTYLKNSNTKMHQIIKEFDFTANQTVDIYMDRASKSIVKNMQSELGTSFTDREKLIIDRILQVDLRVDTVQPVEFFERNFKSFRELYKNVEFNYDHHVENILKMGRRIHEWKTKPEYSEIFYNINSRFRSPILFDKSRTNYDRVRNRYRIYLPMAVAESPFSRDGIKISDFSGLGLEFAGNLEKTFYMSLVFEISKEFLHHQFNTTEFQGQSPVTAAEVDKAEGDILKYHSMLKQLFKGQIAQYKIEGRYWKTIKLESSMDQILTTALFDQSRYHAMSLVVNRYLKDPSTPWQEKKSVLRGLKDYNLKQIFYISLVNRRCEKVGPRKIEQISKYGPLPQSIKNNMALSNLDDFAETFKCPVGSPMNREEKVYFWDRSFEV